MSIYSAGDSRTPGRRDHICPARRGRLALGTCAALALLASLVPVQASSAADDTLVLSGADVPGFKPAGGGTGVARRALGIPQPTAVRRAKAQGRGFRNGRTRLSVGVFSFGSQRAARRAARSLGRGGQSVRVGDSGRLRRLANRRATEVVVVLRVERAVGAVRLRLPGRNPGAARAGLAYADALATRLRHELSLTEWERNLEGIRDDGSFTPELALRAFSMAYGSLPGVRPAVRGPRLDRPDGTLAMQLVARVWGQLTPAQRAAIDQAIGAPFDSASPAVARAALALTPDPASDALATKYVARYSALLPDPLPGPVPVVKTFKASSKLEGVGATGPTYMDTLPIKATGTWGPGNFDYCRLRISPKAQAEVGKPYFEYAIAHEVFHCFQFSLAPKHWAEAADWIIEGTAAWASSVESGVSAEVGGDSYREYLETLSRPLFRRTYDAVGFWGRADQVGGIGSLWAKLPDILNVGSDNAKAYTLAGGAEQTFIDSWATGAWRFSAIGGGNYFSGIGAEWYQTNPYRIPFAEFPSQAATITAAAPLSSKPYAISNYAVAGDSKKPLVKLVAQSGSLRAGTSKEDLGKIGTNWFCFGKCSCSAGEVSSIPSHKTVPAPLLALALTGGPAAGAGQITYHDLDQFCKPKNGNPPSGGLLKRPDPCSLITLQEAEPAAGVPLQPGVVRDAGAGELLCKFDDQSQLSEGFQVSSSAYGTIGEAATKFDQLRKSLKPVSVFGEVPGLGDQNFYFGGCGGMWLRKSNVLISFARVRPDDLPRCIDLAQKLLGRF